MKDTGGYMDLPHYGQILTTKKTIASFIDDIERSVTHNAVCLLSTGIIVDIPFK